VKWSLGRQHTAAGSLTYTNCRVKCRFCTFHQWNSPVRLCTGWPAVPMKLHPPRVGLARRAFFFPLTVPPSARAYTPDAKPGPSAQASRAVTARTRTSMGLRRRCSLSGHLHYIVGDFRVGPAARSLSGKLDHNCPSDPHVMVDNVGDAP
jgi:hypothetical protein